MKRFTKQLLIGIAALGLVAPVITCGTSNIPHTSVSAKRHNRRNHHIYYHHQIYRKYVKHHSKNNVALSYSRAKKDVRKAHIRIDKDGDTSTSLALHNDGKQGSKTYLMAYFGANSNLYFTVIHHGRYAHIHVTVRGNYGNAQEDARHPGLHNWSKRAYRFYGIRRNKTVRAY